MEYNEDILQPGDIVRYTQAETNSLRSRLRLAVIKKITDNVVTINPYDLLFDGSLGQVLDNVNLRRKPWTVSKVPLEELI